MLTILAAAALLAAAAQPPAVAPIDIDSYARVLEDAKARVLVVNMWATWCGPCRSEFPELVRFHREFEPRGVEFITISMDTHSDLEAKVIPFLREQKAAFASYIKSPGDDDAFINAIDPAWSGGLPATFIYDTTGRLVQAIHGRTSYEGLTAIVEPLIGKDE